MDYLRWIMPTSFTTENVEVAADLGEMALAHTHDETGEAAVDVADLLCNLRHFCDRAGVDFDAALTRAGEYYEQNVDEAGRPAKRDTVRFPDAS